MIDKLIEQQETIKGMQENEESAIKIMKMYEDYKLRVDKAIEYIKLKWSYEKLDEVGRNDAIGEAGKTIYEDILREEDTKNVLSILKGENK